MDETAFWATIDHAWVVANKYMGHGEDIPGYLEANRRLTEYFEAPDDELGMIDSMTGSSEEYRAFTQAIFTWAMSVDLETLRKSIAQHRNQLNQLDEPKLERAQYICLNGLRDVHFYYFRSWVIYHGREYVDIAKSDPDSLAKFLTDDKSGELINPYWPTVGHCLIWAHDIRTDNADISSEYLIPYTNTSNELPPIAYDEFENEYPKIWKIMKSQWSISY